MKTHIKKAQLANKLIKLLHSKSEGDAYIWDENYKSIKVKSGFTREGFKKILEKEKVELFNLIYEEVKDTHADIIRARKERRRIRARDAKRLAEDKVPKKRTTKAEWEAMNKLKIA